MENGYTYFRNGDVNRGEDHACFENGKGGLMPAYAMVLDSDCRTHRSSSQRGSH